MDKMKNCEDIADLLSAYIDDEVTEEERRLVASHLECCADCRAQLGALRNTVALMHELGELEVPSEVSRSLSGIAGEGPAVARANRSRFTLPKVRYLVATGAVAAVALVSALSLYNTGTLNTKTELQTGARQNASEQAQAEFGDADARTKAAAPVDSAPETLNSKAKDPGAAAGIQSYDIAKESAQKTGEGNDELLMRGLPDSPTEASAESWPKITASSKNYSAASSEALLDEIHRKTDGLYSVKDATDKRTQMVDAIIAETTRQGGDGKLIQAPLNSLLDRTKVAALPVYVEKATFEKKDCLVIITKWGFGDEKTDLYKTSLYVTDLSGWNTLHYASR